MGNAISPCCQWQPNSSSWVKLVLFEGTTMILTGKRIAGEVMFQYPDSMVCHADSFYIGRPIPALSIDDELVSGQTYFVLPIERFAFKVLSATSLSSLASSPKLAPINLRECPFQYLKSSDGRTVIKVLPEFITKLISRGNSLSCSSPNNSSFLCSTPELKKHYDQLVGSRESMWSPKLETISERKKGSSPCGFLGLEWRSRELEG